MERLIKKAGMREKVFVITSGVSDVREIGKRLIECGLKETTVTVGYALSYPAEQIKTLSPEECMQLTDEGLYTCLIQNQRISGEKKNSDPKFLTHGLPDDAFCRDKVPMTKEEVREAAICKMHLTPDAVVYDIGSGTGSIAVEMARLSDNLTVYAIERKQEAVALIEKNCTKYGTCQCKSDLWGGTRGTYRVSGSNSCIYRWKQWQFKGDINGFIPEKSAYACGGDGNYVRDGWGCFFYIK